MKITYNTDIIPSTEQVIDLYDNCGLPRPTHDQERIAKMVENSDLIVTAWAEGNLVGISRCITDWVWSCYLADLAVKKEFKKAGIGKMLIEITKKTVGEQSMVLLLSVPTAMEYYPKVGFTQLDNSFIIHREK